MSVSKQTGKKVVILSQRIRTEKYLGLYGLLFLVGCAGGGAPTATPITFVSNSYLQNVETKHYSNGSTTTNTATSAPVTWASDHITQTTTYTFSDGTTNPVVVVVAPVLSTPVLTSAVYSPSWTTTGTVTPPSVSSVIATYGDGYVAPAAQTGTPSLPFAQATLVAQSITDPSAVVRSSTTDYNLIWGTPDKSGPGYASLFPSASSQLPVNLGYMGVTVSGLFGFGPTLTQPSPDVLAAWNAGWTGKGQNILLVDDYSSPGTCNSATTCHGITTMMITDLAAPGATKFGLTYSGLIIAKDVDGVALSSPNAINVVNASFGTNWWASAGLAIGVTPTPTQITTLLASEKSFYDAWTNLFSGTISVPNLTNIGSAVIVKSAGNDGIDTNYEQFAKILANNSSVQSRLLIVGALDKNGTTGSPATIASYSNTAGTTAAVANRFVVANGNAPWATWRVIMNGSFIDGANTGNVGTSYAAPLVAGYAAVVMQKFPNLDAVKTSSIILDTARYDTLTCYPSCNTAIYGMGEASLSRALAPVGRLR